MSVLPIRRPNRRSRDQRGLGTIEVLIAMVILSITVGGIATASITAGGVGKKANQEARLNVLMTAFAESVKALPYESCATSSVYQGEFDSSEYGLSAGVRRLTDTEGATFVVEATPGAECPLDSGVQSITLTVTLNGDELERTIIKRTDDVGAEPLDFCIMSPVLGEGNCRDTDPSDGIDERFDPVLRRNSSDGDTVIVWGLRAAGTSSIFQYEWWCDGQWHADNPGADPPRAPDFTTRSAYDPAIECQYAAPTGFQQQRIALRVIENTTLRTNTTSTAFTLPPTSTAHQKPTAQFRQTLPLDCGSAAAPCLEGTQVSFEAYGPYSLDSSVIQWEWNYGDGTPTVLCRPTPAFPDGSNCEDMQHTFLGARPGGGPYPVRLWVTDALGFRSDPAVVNVTISGPPIIRPIVDVSSGLTGNPAWGVSPLAVTFNATGSHMDGYPTGTGAAAGIANYAWDYGVPVDQVPIALQSGPNLSQPTFIYTVSVRTTFTIRLTVTDLNGTTNTAAMTVLVEPLIPPIGIANLGERKSDIWLIRNARFDFQWTNPPAMPGDTMQTQIEISSAGGGFCGFVNLSANPRVFTTPSSAPGSVQGYRASFSSSPRGQNGICSLDSYSFRARTVRTTSNGDVYTSVWSTPQLLNPEFF